MRHIDLCSGIGGFSLAARWIGWETIQFVEIDKFCQKVLSKNFPGTPIHDNLKTFDATKFLGFNGILTAGYPCQPFSQAGKRQGENDERHLWPEVFRIIQECHPAWVVCENVAGHVSMGLDAVLADLEGEDYACQAIIIPACATGAPHRRDRVWIVAYASGERRDDGRNYRQGRYLQGDERFTSEGKPQREGRESGRYAHGEACANEFGSALEGGIVGEGERTSRPVTKCDQDVIRHTDSQRQSQPEGAIRKVGRRAGDTSQDAFDAASERLPDWAGGTFRQPSPLTEFERSDGERKEREVERYICNLDDGLSARLVRDRVNKLKALGNAVVPQVAYQIFQAIEATRKGVFTCRISHQNNNGN